MVTFGIPTLNSENRITTVLESLLGQTYGDFYMVVSDNASSDGTYDVCMEYAAKDNRIAVHRQPERLCMRDNHKFLLEKADSEFFAWKHDDDLLDPKWLEVTVQALQDNPAHVLSFTDLTLERDGEERMKDRCYELSSEIDKMIHQVMIDWRFRVWFMGGFHGLWRTDHLKKTFFPLIKQYDNESLIGSDTFLMFHTAMHGEYSFIKQRLFKKRIISKQRTYRTDYSYRDRYIEANTMISQGRIYMQDVIEKSDYSADEKKKLESLINTVLDKSITNTSWARRLKWRLLPWYRKQMAEHSAG